MTNTDYKAAMAFERVYGYSGDDLQSDVIDLITDIRHLCHNEGLDFDQVIITTEIHFNYEQEGSS